MTVAGRRISVSLLQWVGLIAAPAAWAAQHMFGIVLTLAQCHPAGRTWRLPVHGLTVAATALAATVAVAGLVCAVAAKREIDRQGDAEAPPPARIRFLAVVAIAVSPLMLAIILMSGSGAALHETCRQS